MRIVIRPDSPLEYLIKRKFPDYRELLNAKASVGRGRLFPEERQQRLVQLTAYLQDLHAKPEGEIDALYTDERESEESQRFFNQPRAAADVVHWSKAAHWSIDECIALSFGKAPEVVSWVKLIGLVAVSPFAAQYAKRRDLAQRAVTAGKLYDPVLPSIFLAWARELDIPLPKNLVVATQARQTIAVDWKEQYERLLTLHKKYVVEMDGTLTRQSTTLTATSKANEAALAEIAEKDALITDLLAELQRFRAVAEQAEDGADDAPVEDEVEEEENGSATEQPDETIVSAYEPLPLSAIALMFPISSDEDENRRAWGDLARYAKQRGIVECRVVTGRGQAESLFDPECIGRWLHRKGRMPWSKIKGILDKDVEKKLTSDERQWWFSR